MTVTEKELIQIVKNNFFPSTTGGKLSDENIKQLIRLVFSAISNKLINGDDVIVPLLGKLVVEEVPGRQCRNPRTGEAVYCTAKKKVVFRAGKSFNDDLNNK